MIEALIFFLLLVSFSLTILIYFRGGRFHQQAGGFLFSPIPIVLVTFFLIFAYRPIAILFLHVPTLDYEEIDYEVAVVVIGYGLFWLASFLFFYLFFLFAYDEFRIKNNRALDIPLDKPIYSRLVSLGVIFSIFLIFGLLVYGSAINNTGDRIQNPSEYGGYFLFIVLQRFHYVLSALAFYSLLTKPPAIWRPAIFAIVITSPILSLLAGGRGAMFFLLIAFFTIYVFKRSFRFDAKSLFYALVIGSLFLFLNYLLGIVRIIVSSSGWTFSDVFEVIFSNNADSTLEAGLALASWDFSVFDVFARIISRTDEYLLGETNIVYYLSYIPRVIWPDKPLDQGFMLFVTNKFYGQIFQQTGSTFAGTIMGEGYLNFGVLGVCLYAAIFAWILFLLYRNTFIKRNVTSLIIYSFALPFSQNVVRGGLDNMGNFLLLILVPIMILMSFLFRRV
jgi:oligosaccharide repeat unit polymerase